EAVGHQVEGVVGVVTHIHISDARPDELGDLDDGTTAHDGQPDHHGQARDAPSGTRAGDALHRLPRQQAETGRGGEMEDLVVADGTDDVGEVERPPFYEDHSA